MDANFLEKRLNISRPSMVHRIHFPVFEEKKLHVSIKRDDLLHPIISGNKWRKLKYQLLLHINNSQNSIISFGGAWSNHLHALGYCCYQLKIPFTAFIRGEFSNTPSAMIRDLQNWGTDIQYLNRSDYRKKHLPQFLQELQGQNPQATIIPEGGSHMGAFQGLEELISELPLDTDVFCMAVGSGGTIAGSVLANKYEYMRILGIPVVNDFDDIQLRIRNLLQQAFHNEGEYNNAINKLTLLDGYHLGGYAKINQELIDFMKLFYQLNEVMLEPVYTAKMMLAITQLAQKDVFKPEQKIILLHSGGLQGLRGFGKYHLDRWYQNNSE